MQIILTHCTVKIPYWFLIEHTVHQSGSCIRLQFVDRRIHCNLMKNNFSINNAIQLLDNVHQSMGQKYLHVWIIGEALALVYMSIKHSYTVVNFRCHYRLWSNRYATTREHCLYSQMVQCLSTITYCSQQMDHQDGLR